MGFISQEPAAVVATKTKANIGRQQHGQQQPVVIVKRVVVPIEDVAVARKVGNAADQLWDQVAPGPVRLRQCCRNGCPNICLSTTPANSRFKFSLLWHLLALIMKYSKKYFLYFYA